MNESVFRKLATLTSVRRARQYDAARTERSGDPGREDRIAQSVERLEANVEALKMELKVVDERHHWKNRKAA